MEQWQVLDIYDGDPTPGEPASIRAMAADSRRAVGEADEHGTRLRAIAAASGALALRGDFAATVEQELALLPAEAKALADAHLACTRALSSFADELERVQRQSRSALQRGMAADSQYRSLLDQFCALTRRSPRGSGIWRGLTESDASGEREPVYSMASSVGRSARLCEAERQEARAAALQAKGLYQEAAGRCATAIRAATLTSTRLNAARRSAPDTGASSSTTSGRIAGPAGKKPQLPPHPRHNLERVQPGSRTKAANTVVLPTADVTKDIDDINSGRATWDAGRQRYVVNGRTYIPKDGRMVPESGPGLEALDHQEYESLKAYIRFDGDLDAADAELSRDPYNTPAHRARALEVFRHHSKYQE
ncbi:hypothetical protein ACGFH8_00160 [Micromonospora sp. NPDC049175]|uniref:hypothetical protein n=1 Tax=Micromonospora sp. NPDC049175 TaxID=3364266 RepID=UPI003722B5D7